MEHPLESVQFRSLEFYCTGPKERNVSHFCISTVRDSLIHSNKDSMYHICNV
jgi:hypothetical protein